MGINAAALLETQDRMRAAGSRLPCCVQEVHTEAAKQANIADRILRGFPEMADILCVANIGREILYCQHVEY